MKTWRKREHELCGHPGKNILERRNGKCKHPTCQGTGEKNQISKDRGMGAEVRWVARKDQHGCGGPQSLAICTG